MKQRILYILLLITTWIGGTNDVHAWGETTSYVVQVYGDKKAVDIGTVSWDGPACQLTFEAYKTMATAVGDLEVKQSTNGSDWSTLYSIAVGKLERNQYKSFTVTITNTQIRYIKFENKGSYSRYIRNIKVTRATTFSTTTSSIDFSPVNVNGSSTKQASITYNNTTYDQQVTGTCNNGYFTVSPDTVGDTGETTVDVVYNPKAPGVHTGTVTLSMNGKSVSFSVSGTCLAPYYFSALAYPNNDNFGTASASVDASITSSNASETKTATFSATANDGYEFVGWGNTADATSYESTANPYQTDITNSAFGTTATKQLYAIFRPVYNFSVQAEKIYDHGTVGASVTEKILGEPTATSVSTQATFVATPNDGCTFEGWYYDREHTQLASKDAHYTPTLQNNTPGSTQNLTLYAWFKGTQTISWKNNIQDFNLIQGTTIDCSAESNRGLIVTYSSSNPDVASVDENGIVTGNQPSNDAVVITASQKGSDEFNAAQVLTRSFYVLQKWQPVFTVSGFTGNAPTLKVGDTPTITVSNVGEDFTFSSSDGTVVSIARNGNVLTLNALKAGNAKVTLSQPLSNTHNAASAEYTITVERHHGGLYLSLPEAMKVGDKATDFWTTTNSEVPVVVESNDPNVLSYADGTLTAVGEGTAVITVSQAENNKWAGESRQHTITVSKVANTLGVSLAALETKVGSAIAVTLSNQNNTETPITASITEQELASDVNEGTEVISYSNGVITAHNAGKAKITFTQSASNKYEAFTSSTYEIVVTKHANPITVSLDGGNALSIRLKYSATASLAYASVHTDTPISVSRSMGNYTTLSGNTITAGSAAGTDVYEITQAETYKYDAGYAMFSVMVNNTSEELGYVVYDEKQYSHGTGSGVVHTYEMSGPGDILYYSVRTDLAAIYYHLYVEYSPNNSDWYQAQDNQSLSDSYRDFSCAIPETARYVRFRFPGGGTLTKYIKNVKVPRKTYVRVSSDKTDFGTIYTGSTSQASFTVDYSTTNGGNIHVNSSNPNFTVSSEELAVSAHSDGTKTFKVTYTPNPAQLGEEYALITISDLFYTQEITLKAVAAKKDNTLNVVGEQNLKVGDVVDNVYSGKNSDAELTVSLSNEGVVSYDATSNSLTAIGEGSTTVTIYQSANDRYHAVTKTILVNVSKSSNTLVMTIDKSDLKVGENVPVNFNDKNSDGAITASYTVDGIVEFRDGKIVALKAGSTSITLTQAATSAYNAVSQSFDITVTKYDQTLQWDNDLSGKELELAIGQTLDANTAKASSALAISYSSSNPAALSVDPTTGRLTAISSGVNIEITATQAGNEMYNAASITRIFTVIDKMEATVITSLSSSETNELRIGGGSVTIGCVTPISEENFAISGETGVVATTFENNTLTITPMKIGEVTITLNREEDDTYYAVNQTYHIKVLGASVILRPDEVPEYANGEYAEVALGRTFAVGHSTLALPFDTDISDLSEDAGAYAAQLSLVTYNAQDGYTLYFKKVDGGAMLANQPYVIYLPSVKTSVTWSNVTIDAPVPSDKEEGPGERFQGWTMCANYTPGVPMEGKYGIAGGKMCLGTAGSTINAYTAYFVPPTASGARVRMAVVDDEGVTFIDSVQEAEDGEKMEVFRLDGRRQPTMTKGINIIRMEDGTVRKVIKR